MIKVGSKTLYTETPFIHPEKSEENKEVKKVSELLEKILTQGEKVIIDGDKREESAKTDIHIDSPQTPPTQKGEQALAQSGINENTKNNATKKEVDIQMVNDLVKMSNRCIISIKSQFPWDFFPNIINVEESRVTFRFNQFLSSQTHSVDIKDISNIFIETSMFFSTLQIVSRTFTQNEIKIGFLNKNKAQKVQGIIEGLRTFAEHDISTSNYEIDELIAKIEEIHANNAS